MWTVALLVFISTVLATAAWLLFLWAVKSDQYDDVEGPKHRMMDDDEPVRNAAVSRDPWPKERRGRGKPGRASGKSRPVRRS
ncbi:MAG: cbb3-type cytochrome oxidase assembly protein CcoS [Deltaproteobacteria bacterium]